MPEDAADKKVETITAYEVTRWEISCPNCGAVNILPHEECVSGAEFGVSCKNCDLKMNVRGSV